ncbi:hypothetical protein AB205_0219760, partial [Aquarana catesbeiana]
MSSQQPDDGKGGEAAGFPSQQQMAPQNDARNPSEELATGPSAAGLCPQLTNDAISICIPQGCLAQQMAPQNDARNPAEELATGPSAAGLCPQLTNDAVSICIPQGCWAVGPYPQQHDEVSPATLSSLQQLEGLQGEGLVRTSPQRRVCSLREAEVCWVYN